MGFMDKVKDLTEKTNLDDKTMAELKQRKMKHQDEQIDKD